MMTTSNLTEELNRLINIALASGLTVTQITTALGAQSTALSAVNPVPTRDRTITDPGAALNPSQP